MAAYLRGDAAAKPTTEKVLERLTTPQAIAPAPVTQPATTVDNKKLDALAYPQPETPAPAPAPKEAKPVADMEKADEKLSSLLGKPK